MTEAHKKAISKANKGHRVSKETKLKIGRANKKRITRECDNCGKKLEIQLSVAKKNKRNFCKGEMKFQPKTKYSVQVSIQSVVNAESVAEARDKVRGLVNKANSFLSSDEVVDLGANYRFKVKRLTRRPAFSSSHQKGGEKNG